MLGACKRLAPEIAGSRAIAEMSKHFVMVNCEDDEEPLHNKFKPVSYSGFVCLWLTVFALPHSTQRLFLDRSLPSLHSPATNPFPVIYFLPPTSVWHCVPFSRTGHSRVFWRGGC